VARNKKHVTYKVVSIVAHFLAETMLAWKEWDNIVKALKQKIVTSETVFMNREKLKCFRLTKAKGFFHLSVCPTIIAKRM
jgi:hypothetical protein